MSRYVISDIHGCCKTFQSLLDKIALNKDDSLYLLGDYIDRGSNSSGVLDTILELQKQDYQVYPIRGNHEEYILQAEKEYDLPTFNHYVRKINKSGDLLDENNGLQSKYRDFFESLPYYYNLDDFILVHAGLNLSIDKPFEDINTMIDLRGFRIEENHHPVLGSRRVIHGHMPNDYEDILANIKERHTVIPLDNGCVYNKKHKIYDYTKLGKLLCLELDSFALTVQENID